jgi:K+-sensing histidine kinase KdpD
VTFALGGHLFNNLKIRLCTGMGIDKAIQPRIFSKFATKSNSGTGLGSFISKAIVQAHGGHIQASNNLNGKKDIFAIPGVYGFDSSETRL